MLQAESLQQDPLRSRAKTIDEYYGNILEADDGTISHLLSCDYNLSPENIVEPAKTIAFSKISKGMTTYVLPFA